MVKRAVKKEDPESTHHHAMQICEACGVTVFSCRCVAQKTATYVGKDQCPACRQRGDAPVPAPACQIDPMTISPGSEPRPSITYGLDREL